jgi:Protein of unknown function (DUF4242)
MPRYLIERTFEVDENNMPRIGRKSNQVISQLPGVVWDHSHVVIDEQGNVKTFCIYDAPDEETVRKHSSQLGEHALDRIYEIGGDVTPADFPPERG